MLLILYVTLFGILYSGMVPILYEKYKFFRGNANVIYHFYNLLKVSRVHRQLKALNPFSFDRNMKRSTKLKLKK